MNLEKELEVRNFLKSQIGKPFQRGFRDCNTLAVHVLDMIAGTNYKEKVIGRYKNKKEAIRFVRDGGWCWVDGLLKLGAKEVPKNFETTGDFLVIKKKWWEEIYVCLGRECVGVYEDTGVQVVPMVMIGKYRAFRLVE